MKKKLAILLLAVLFVGSELQAQDTAKSVLRTWKGSTGQFSFQATFVRVIGDRVILQGIDKKEISLPLSKLSAADQLYVEIRRTPVVIGKKTITNTIGMKLNKIPAGTFMMGSPESEPDRSENEQQHKVRISKAFYMQTTEVTQEQWTAVMGTEPRRSGKEGPNYPVTSVRWDDAVAYCKKLSEKEGKTYRLPTEAEWEYACRAGTNTTWSFGDDEKDLGDYGWYKENAFDIGMLGAYTTCTATFGNGATIIMEMITTRSRAKRIQWAQRRALSVFFGVGRGTTTRVTLVPLSAVGTTAVSSTGFGWFVSWIP